MHSALPRLLWECKHYYYLGRNPLEINFMPKNDYKELVAQAEKAVSSVSDPSLKQIAFRHVSPNVFAPKARTSWRH